MRYALVLLYAVAGWFHLARPSPFLGIMPQGLPAPEAIVFWTGIAEFAGAAGLAQAWSPKLRRAAATGLAAYALCVFPANINHFIIDMAKPGGGLGLTYHVPRMLAQPLLIWAALYAGGAIDWPFGRRTAP